MSKKDQLLVDAESAGYTIRRDSDGTIFITLPDGRSKTKILRGIVIYSDDSAYDMTIRLDMAKTIRSYKAMRQILKLK